MARYVPLTLEFRKSSLRLWTKKFGNLTPEEQRATVHGIAMPNKNLLATALKVREENL
jgi:hypothetical protein